MIHKKLRVNRSFCAWSNWSNKGVFNVPRRATALLLLGALSLSSVAHGQAPGITVNAIPYVLTNNGGITIVTNYPVKPIPRAVQGSSFVSLFGGGFAAVLPNYSESIGAVAAMVAVKKLQYMKASAYATKTVQEYEIESINAQNNLGPTCGLKTNAVPAHFTMVSHVSSRIRALRTRNAFPKLAAADTCELPEEEQAEETQEELEALNESETASQEALESAEEAVEAAEVAAEAAESAAEAALEAAEVLETILEACSLF